MWNAWDTGCGIDAPPEMKVCTDFMTSGSPRRARRLYIGGTMMAIVTECSTIVFVISDGLFERRMTMVACA